MIFDLDPNLRWAFCMTHPDDEISICAWIKRLVENGNEVFLSWTHSTPRREREGRAAAALIGVPEDHLMFFGAPDGEVIDHVAYLIEEFRDWFLIVQPDRACCGAFEQGHLDHDATNFIVNQAFRGPVFEIPFYHTYLVRLQKINRFADPRGEEVRPLDAHQQEFKKLVAKQYPSTNIWSVLLWYELLQGSKLKRADLAKTERMRLQTHKDFLTANLPPRLAERVKKCPKWKRWEKAVRALSTGR
ncbi:MAG: PIG-L family deacetylase [Fimbriimonadales bacterium]